MKYLTIELLLWKKNKIFFLFFILLKHVIDKFSKIKNVKVLFAQNDSLFGRSLHTKKKC